jgi:hypothetical protein
MVGGNGAWVRQGEAFWRAHHEARKRSDLNEREISHQRSNRPAGFLGRLPNRPFSTP